MTRYVLLQGLSLQKLTILRDIFLEDGLIRCTLSGTMSSVAKKRLIRLVVILIALLVVYALPYLTSQTNVPPPPAGFYRVTEFADGDTVVVSMNGRDERVRFIGVDTPESHHPTKPKQCFSSQASQYTKQKIEQSAYNVRLQADPISDARDRYNRLLRYVYTSEGELLNQALIRDGQGFAYTLFPFGKSTDFVAAQKQASQQKRGLWAACQATFDGGAWRTNPDGAS